MNNPQLTEDSVGRIFTLKTPDGPFTVITRASEPVVLASGWTDEPAELTPQIHSSLRPAELRQSSAESNIKAAVDAFYAGELNAIDGIEVAQKSGPFRTHAWEVLRRVPAGQPVTYSEYAERAGNPRAIRAAASACAMNAAALFVPCHRIVRLDGGLGGFRWGLQIKESLLRREAENAGMSPERII
ncbi:methylated-DNA-[protein]-cysteine S-methyltransferase [Psychromicrobium silvestre]|uniref:Methylated-DNA-[protein]-cysteine S-methyltransferase n=1 Tax=Psychromicrobium silvestre TaxID=1645614 RepID=A0A7Y9S3G9_9MICC|nr:methylated-DNA--[protein]-cysteine S-methyltransferase [Psychromicrobium silvestre]NYE93814.1 methylated-DNA-[protein]-cysteine S-methyltransferase [Psychromicrobium silvestre]